MDIFLYILVGVLGGILGGMGMGMGGGTVLIPLLCFLLNVSLTTAQAINLISFIPMAIISLIIHIKNKLIKFNDVIIIVIFGLISCFIFSYLSRSISGDILKKFFGGFLIVLSVSQIILIKKIKK